MALEEQVNPPLTITAWEIAGIKETRSEIETRVKDNAWAWEFTPSSPTVTITYTLSVPKNSQEHATLTAVWFDRDGFKRDERTLIIGAQVTHPPKPQAATAPTPQKTPPLSSPKTPADGASRTGIILMLAIIAIGLAGYAVFSYSRRAPRRAKKKR
ncbi:MAG TPA: hypothetical protein VJH22_05245, partial [Candidatus Nanoarchaeia archaeon]|nr:hypothetical protein [Candidatus Nanoarchaeia archaeon]